MADLGDGDEAGGVEVAAMEEVELGEKREGAEEGAEGEGRATLTNEKRVLSVLTNQRQVLPGTQWSPPSHVDHPRHHYLDSLKIRRGVKVFYLTFKEERELFLIDSESER